MLVRLLATQAALLATWAVLLLARGHSLPLFVFAAVGGGLVLLGVLVWLSIAYAWPENGQPLALGCLALYAVILFAGPLHAIHLYRGESPTIPVGEAPAHAGRCFLRLTDAHARLEHAKTVRRHGGYRNWLGEFQVFVAPLTPRAWTERDPVPAWIVCEIPTGHRPEQHPECVADGDWSGAVHPLCLSLADLPADVSGLIDQKPGASGMELRSAPGAPLLARGALPEGALAHLVAAGVLAALLQVLAFAWVVLGQRGAPDGLQAEVQRSLTADGRVDLFALASFARRALPGRRAVQDALEQLPPAALQGLQRAAKALEAGTVVREGALDVACSRRLAEVAESKAAAAVVGTVGDCARRGYVAPGAAQQALSAVLDHGDEEQLRATYKGLAKLVGRDARRLRGSSVAYNLACAAARLRRKQEMLAWLRVAAQSGDTVEEALTDKDFEGWHHDRELVQLVRRLGPN